MGLMTVTSPHVIKPGNTGSFMRQVIYAAIPGIAVITWFFGWGTLINILLASALAVGFEAIILHLRKKPIGFYLQDYSAVLTAVLLAISIPPASPWWLTTLGIFFAIVIAKHLYGGLGSNPFNPAMVGYIVLLISFPTEMTSWLPPVALDGTPGLEFTESLSLIFTGTANHQTIDAFTMATPLDTFKTYAGNHDLQEYPILQGLIAGVGWEWVNLGFLLGGLYLLYRKIITWHIPVSMLAAIFFLSGFFNTAIDPHHYGSIGHHLLGGGTMLGAFFIATDPVTAASSNKGRVIYGIGIGVLIYIIRTWGGYPDAVAFGVLLMNLCAPTIDYYTRPRTYGHQKPDRGITSKE